MKATGIVRRIDDLGRLLSPRRYVGPCGFVRVILWKYSLIVKAKLY